jgi:tetratricopeptide (TPR) repeat protein
MKRECTAALAGGARGSIRAARPGDEPTVENFLIHLETRRSRGGAPKEDAEAAAEQALAAIRAVQQSDPEEADYHFILGEALRDLGRHSEAIAALRTAARMNERDAGYRCGLAEALWESSQYEKAARIFREALDRAPGDPQALSGLGAALLELHRDREALEPLREALRRDRRRWDALSNVGIARWRLGEKDEAVRAFRSAVRQQPSAAHARRNLGLALGALGRHSEALKVLRKARRDLPDEPAIRVDLADTLHALGRLAEALAVYRDTVDSHPGCLAERSGSREAFEELTVKELREELGTPSGFQRLLTALVTADVRGARAGSGAARRPARLGLALALLLLAGMIHVGWVLIPPHFRHFVFQDDVSAIAGAPLTDDADVLDRLMHAVRDRGLEGHVRGSQFEIATRPKWRNIQCHYEVPVRFLLYWTWTLSFEVSVERPYLLPKETIFI